MDVNDYDGFMLPCMAAGNSADPKVIPAESITLVKNAISAGKPVAAQTGTVWVLEQAGVLKGKKYASFAEPFEEGIHSGTGVVRDGLIVTAGICPHTARMIKAEDMTTQLTLAFIDAIKGKE